MTSPDGAPNNVAPNNPIYALCYTLNKHTIQRERRNAEQAIAQHEHAVLHTLEELTDPNTTLPRRYWCTWETNGTSPQWHLTYAEPVQGARKTGLIERSLRLGTFCVIAPATLLTLMLCGVAINDLTIIAVSAFSLLVATLCAMYGTRAYVQHPRTLSMYQKMWEQIDTHTS